MAWQYCEGRRGCCTHAFDNPTPQEVCKQKQVCPECGYENDPRKSLGELVAELVERIEQLEQGK